jgi:chromosome segregation ATPase
MKDLKGEAEAINQIRGQLSELSETRKDVAAAVRDVSAKRADLKKVEARFEQINRAAAALEEKMGQLRNEEKRVDAVAEKLAQVSFLAKDIDAKMANLKSTNDRLDDLQKKLARSDVILNEALKRTSETKPPA